MKISLASDVHLEFGQLEIKNTENAKVLILSGDICVANDLNDRADVNILGESHKSNRYMTPPHTRRIKWRTKPAPPPPPPRGHFS